MQRRLMAQRRAAERGVTIPPVKNPARRKAAGKSLIKFKRSYFPELAYLKIAPFQERRLEEKEAAIRYGGKGARAEPRGSAKTTDSMIAAMWAVLYGYKKHFFVIRANADEAEDFIKDIKAELEANDLLLEDFPEVCAPIRALEGAAQRANGQTVAGQRTRMQYQTDRIVLPTVKGSKCSGSVLSASGIMGKIRGRKINKRRPDFVLLDDIEDKESTESQTISSKIIDIIRSDVGGLGGPGIAVATWWIGTIIKRKCLIDQYTDRNLHPEWQGSRQAAIVTWPGSAGMKLWEEYTALLAEGKKSGDDPTGRKAMEFYRANRKAMDDGATVAWDDNFIRDLAPDGTPLEISALQSLMNRRFENGEDAFLTEYQNDPPDPAARVGLTPKTIAGRLSGYPHRVVPEGYDFKLVQGIDVRGREIHYVVKGFREDGSSSVVDYDILQVFAPQGDLSDPKAAVRPALEVAVLDALRRRRDEIRADVTPYRNPQGQTVEIALSIVDAGWLPKVIALFVKESGPRWRMAIGRQFKKGSLRYSRPAKAADMTFGDGWHSRIQGNGQRLFFIDADHYKLRSHESWSQTVGTPGASDLFGLDPKQHSLFSSHICAESWNPERNAFDELSRWNHFLDCDAQCQAAANMVGVGVIKNEKMPSGRPVNLGDWMKKQKRSAA